MDLHTAFQASSKESRVFSWILSSLAQAVCRVNIEVNGVKNIVRRKKAGKYSRVIMQFTPPCDVWDLYNLASTAPSFL